MNIQSCLNDSSTPRVFAGLHIKVASDQDFTSASKTAESQSVAIAETPESVSNRFEAEMARRLDAAPVKDDQGNVKDYHSLLDSLVGAITSLEDHTDTKTATAAMAMVLQYTGDKASESNLSAGLCAALVHVHDNFGSEVYGDVVSEWNQVALRDVVNQEEQLDPDTSDSIGYALTKYFNSEIEMSTTGGSARIILFQGSGGEGGEAFNVKRETRYIFGQEIVSSTGAGINACEFKTSLVKDDLQSIADFFRNDIKSEQAGDLVQNLGGDGVFEEEMARVLSVIYMEKGLEGLNKAAAFINDSLAEVINEKVAPAYTNGYGDKTAFSGVSVIPPMPEIKKASCEISFDWGTIRSPDGYFGITGGMHWSMDDLLGNVQDTAKQEEAGSTFSQVLPTSNSLPGVLLDKTA